MCHILAICYPQGLPALSHVNLPAGLESILHLQAERARFPTGTSELISIPPIWICFLSCLILLSLSFSHFVPFLHFPPAPCWFTGSIYQPYSVHTHTRTHTHSHAPTRILSRASSVYSCLDRPGFSLSATSNSLVRVCVSGRRKKERKAQHEQFQIIVLHTHDSTLTQRRGFFPSYMIIITLPGSFTRQSPTPYALVRNKDLPTY